MLFDKKNKSTIVIVSWKYKAKLKSGKKNCW